MNVTFDGSVRRLRISFATRPTATRSREREQRDRVLVGDPLAVERLLEDVVDGGDGLGDDASRRDLLAHEAQLGDVRELAGVARHLEERVEAGALARPEAVAELLEVAREEARAGSRSASLACCASRSGSERASRTDATSACSSSISPSATGSGAAQTANTIGSPVRSSQSRPRSKCGVGSSNALRSAASPMSSFASASIAERHDLRLRQAGSASARPRSRSRVSRRPSAPARTASASRAGSSRPRPPRRRTGAAGSAGDRRSARTRSTEIGAMSISPSSSMRLSSVGTPVDLLDVGLEPVEDGRHVHVRDAAEPSPPLPPAHDPGDHRGQDESAPERDRGSRCAPGEAASFVGRGRARRT